MKLFLMTDMEGVCGVVHFNDWATPQGRYYEDGKTLLTREANAAIEGFFQAGATEIRVVDGHGHGGVNVRLLDPRVEYQRGHRLGPNPFLLDESFDAIAWVGQHAKAGAAFAHMPHTGSFHVVDYRINGRSIGEFGELALTGALLGVRSIFGAGDEAFAREAADLIGGIETVGVKRGIAPGGADELGAEEYMRRHDGAIHLHPAKARERIREGAARALRRFAQHREQFHLLKLDPPYRREVVYRGNGKREAHTDVAEHPTSLLPLLTIT